MFSPVLNRLFKKGGESLLCMASIFVDGPLLVPGLPITWFKTAYRRNQFQWRDSIAAVQFPPLSIGLIQVGLLLIL